MVRIASRNAAAACAGLLAREMLREMGKSILEGRRTGHDDIATGFEYFG